MLQRFDHLRGYPLRATDGSLGSVTDFLFDDESWRIRWLVVDTAWLFGRRVLLAPEALGSPDDLAGELPVKLTKEQIRSAPDVDTEKPVSRQQEEQLFTHYGWAPYWGVGAWGAPILPTAGVPFPPAGIASTSLADDEVRREAAEREAARHDPHLRSGREVTGYHIRATDDSVGHVEDFLIDTDDWAIRYLLVDTRNWLPGRKVLVAIGWALGVSWTDREVSLDLSRRQIESSPEYDGNKTIPRDYEDKLHRHYGRDGYWTATRL